MAACDNTKKMGVTIWTGLNHQEGNLFRNGSILGWLLLKLDLKSMASTLKAIAGK